MLVSPDRRRACAAVALLASILCIGSSEADAGLGIIIVEADLQPIGDPLTQYDFRLALAPQNTISQGDNITLLNVPDFDGNDRAVISVMGTDLSSAFSIFTTKNQDGTTQIELELTNSAITINNNGTSALSIGDLFVETSVNYPPPTGSPVFNQITYTSQSHVNGQINQGTGVTSAQSIVPEPPSLALLGVGVASGVLLSRRPRRRLGPA